MQREHLVADMYDPNSVGSEQRGHWHLERSLHQKSNINLPEAFAHLQMVPSVNSAPQGVSVGCTDNLALLYSSCAVDIDGVVRVKSVSCVRPGKKVTQLKL